MKKILEIFLFSLIFLPATAFAVCEAGGNTVVYVNGILTNKRDAQDDTYLLKTEFEEKTGRADVAFINGYNQSHIGGAGDLIESAAQLLGSTVTNYDRDTILLQIHPEVTTRKILLVGHSQGTFYTNEMYDYFLGHGESKEAVGVYNIATPASFVSGGGAYVTSENDKVINSVRGVAQKLGAKQPLPANIAIPLTLQEAADSFGGHSFNGVYLANDAARIVSEIEDALKKLVAGVPDTMTRHSVQDVEAAGCFIPPARDAAYYAQKVTFAIADTAATGVVAANKGIAAEVVAVNKSIVAVGQATYNATLAATRSVIGVAETAYRNIEKWFANESYQSLAVVSNYFGNAPQPSPQNRPSENAPQKSEESQTQNQPPAEIQNKNQENFPNLQANIAPETNAPSETTSNSSLSKNPPSPNSLSENKTENISSNYSVSFGGGSGGGGSAQVGGVSVILNPSSNPSVSAVGNQNSTSNASQNSSTSLTINSASTSSIGNSSSTASNSSSSASSTPAIASSTASSTSPSSSISHILISEVLFNPVGSDKSKEFAELYNPVESQIDLSGWSLKYKKENGTSTTSLASFKTSSHPEDKTLIQKKGFLLIGLNGYAETSTKPADIRRAAALPNGETNGGQPEKIELILSNSSSSEIDKISYDKNSISSEGQSLERKALQSGVCASAQNNGEFLGNDCDTDQNGDFEVRSSPNPQNSGSLPEPRSAPAINNFKLAYDFAPRFDFSWDLSQDTTGATSTLSYFIYDTSNPSSTKLFEASSTASSSFAYSINEVSRDYSFKLEIQDRDGLSSTSTSTIAAKSFLDNFYFYRGSRPSSAAYFFDLATTSSRPFWNAADSSMTQSWKAIVFYLNKAAPKENIISTDNSLTPSDSAFVAVRYSTCAGPESSEPELLLPFNNYSCQGGGLMSGANLFSNLEDGRFTVKLSSSSSDISFSSGDYVTLAFYDFGGGGGGSQRLRLAAVDKIKYYFKDTPQNQNAPAAPGNFSVDFPTSTGMLNLNWSSSTDADSLDYLIKYEVDYSTSTILSNSSWQSVGTYTFSTSTIPIFPNTYKIGVRAVDDFGNISTPSVVDWNFPAGFVALPSQLNHDAVIGTTGSGQKILISNSAIINGAALWAGPDGGPYNNSQSYLELHRDNDNSIGELLATSTAKTLGQYDSSREVVYALSSPVSLAASSSYWLVPVQVPSAKTNGTRIYGTASNSYPDGYWSSQPGADGYFRLIQK